MACPYRPAAVIAFAVSLVASASAAAPWLKLRTDEIVIYSDASQKDVVEFAVGYSAFRHVFRQVIAPPHAPPPIRVLLFRRLRDFQQRVPKSKSDDGETVSYSAEIDGEPLIALAVDGDRREALQRTYEFDCVWELGRVGYFVPIWMSQGTGEVLSTMTLSKGRCTVGEGPRSYEESWDDSGAIEWKRFFDISTSSPEYSGKNATGHFHAQAWALMHRLLLEGEHGPLVFNGLATKLRDTDALAAVEAALDLPERKFSTEINRHLHSKYAVREFPFDADGLRKTLKTEPAPDGEVHAMMADLLFATGRDDDGDGELARAQALAAQSPEVKQAMARHALRAGQPDEAAQLYREAIAAGSTSAVAYLRSAELRMNEFSTGNTDRAGEGGPAIDQTLAEIRKALTLHPGSTEGYRLLGRALFLTPNPTPEDIQELSAGVSRGSEGETVRYYRALLENRLGRKDEYFADLRRIVADRTTSPSLARTVRGRLVEEEFNATVEEVESFVKSRRFVDAHASLKKALSSDTSSDAAARYRSLEAWLDENEALDGLHERFNAKQWDQVVEAGTKFLEQYPESPSAARVKRAVEEARRRTNASGPVTKTGASDTGAAQ